MPRSLKKGPYVDQKLLAKIDAVAEAGSDRKPIKTWSPKPRSTHSVHIHFNLLVNDRPRKR